MRTIINLARFWLLLPALLVFHSYALSAGHDADEVRTITKSFPATGNTSVEVTNKYGNVYVSTWEKNQVAVEITIKATARNQEAAKKLVDKIEFDFDHSNYFVNIKQVDAGSKGMIGSALEHTLDQTWSIITSQKAEVSINVNMPAKCKLIVNNKFGDVYLPNLSNTVRTEIEYGDLRANELKDGKSLSVKHGTVNIQLLQKGYLDLNYGDLILEKAGDIHINSRSSEMDITEAGNIHLTSKHDKIRIEKVNKITGSSGFSYITVKQLKDHVDIKSSYGDVDLLKISKSFNNISVNGNYTDYSMLFEAGTASNFKVVLKDGKEFSYGKGEVTILDTSETEDTKTVEGKIGAGNAGKLVTVTGKGSYVSIKYYN